MHDNAHVRHGALIAGLAGHAVNPEDDDMCAVNVKHILAGRRRFSYAFSWDLVCRGEEYLAAKKPAMLLV